MCSGPEYSNSVSVCSVSDEVMGEHGLEVGGGSRKPLSPASAALEKAGSRENSRISLLELAANNDLDGFRHAVEVEGAQVDELGSWYGRQNGTNQMVLEQRTPSMIAALYGSVDVLSYILSFFDACGCDINRKCGVDGSTALHCAAAGGTPRAVETVKLLLKCGADRDALDNHGRRAADVIFAPKMPHIKAHLDRMLRLDSSCSSSSSSSSSSSNCSSSVAINVPSPSSSTSRSSTSPTGGLNSSTSSGSSFQDSASAAAAVGVAALPFSAVSSPPTPNGCDVARGKTSFLQLSSANGSSASTDSSSHLMCGSSALSTGGSSDVSLPDVKSSIYATDEFRMYSFKVKSCSRAYSHDWTECPFVHPGENARRRDPRRYHYSCVPCPDFRKGSCRRGDSCEYAHGVFECWLHPAQYRTRLCKEGLKCTRRVCFFAHTSEELRPLYTTSGSATLPPPRCTSPIDMRSLSPPLPPPSPQSVLFPYSPATSPSGLPTPPLSPSTSSSLSVWAPNVQSSVPTLHLPSGMHAARVRGMQAAQAQAQAAAAAKARADGHRSAAAGLEQDAERLADLAASLSISRPSPVPSVSSSPSSSSGLTPRIGHALHNFSNVSSAGLQLGNASLDDLISSAVGDNAGALAGASSAAAALQSAIQSRHQQAHAHQWRLNVSSASPLSSPIRRSASARFSGSDRDQQSLLALSPSLAAAVLNRKHSFSGHEKYTDPSWRVSSSNGGVGMTTTESAFMSLGGSSVASSSMMSSSTISSSVDLSDWGSPTGKLDWGVSNEQFARFRKSTSYLPSLSARASSLLFDEPMPDLTWVQKLVRETAGEATADCAASAALECLPRESSMERVMAGRWVDPLLQERVA